MKQPLLVRVKRLGKLEPEVRNKFPEAAAKRKLYETGEFLQFRYNEPSNLFRDLFGDMISPPTLYFLIENGGIYSQDEVEIVTYREIELENVLFDIQTVFPNGNPSAICGLNASESDELILNEAIPLARKLIRESAPMQYVRGVRRQTSKIKQLRDTLIKRDLENLNKLWQSWY